MTELTWEAGPPKSLGRTFVAYGMIGFWIQLVVLIAVAILGFYTFRVTGSKAGIGGLLAFLGLALPVFTTLWCYRYARLGRALATEAPGPGPASLSRSAWVGVWAGAAGTLVSLMSLLAAASALVVTMLANPQIGIQVSPASQGASAYTVSAIDAVSMMTLLLALTAELVVVAVSFRLVFLVSAASRRGVAA